MRIRIVWDPISWCVRSRSAVHGALSGGVAHLETVLYERDTETGSRAVLGGVCGVKEVGEQEADELEGHGDESVPDEGEERADQKTVDEDIIRVAAGAVR